jgi:hypothetical protein
VRPDHAHSPGVATGKRAKSRRGTDDPSLGPPLRLIQPFTHIRDPLVLLGCMGVYVGLLWLLPSLPATALLISVAFLSYATVVLMGVLSPNLRSWLGEAALISKGRRNGQDCEKGKNRVVGS